MAVAIKVKWNKVKVVLRYSRMMAKKLTRYLWRQENLKFAVNLK